MKRILSTAVLAGISILAHADLMVNVPANQAIPDGDLSGLGSLATVSGQSGTIGGITVGLTTTGTFNGDLYAYLTHGNGFAVLLDRVGVSTTDNLGYSDHGFDVVFQDGAPNIHTYQQTLGGGTGSSPLTGVWGPDGRPVSPLLVNGTEPATATLSSFLGGDPNGDWTLFIADVNGGDLNNLVSWNLDITVVPESQWFGFGAAVLCVTLAGASWRARNRQTLAARS
jgi:subtilisin-like proprotein convertase family protein